MPCRNTFHWQRAVEQPFAQRLAIDELHRDERPVRGLAHFVDGADVRMIQRGGIAGFAQQSRAGRFVVSCRFENLERHAPPQRRVVREIHEAHPAAAKPTLDLIAAERDAGLELGTHRVGVLRHGLGYPSRNLCLMLPERWSRGLGVKRGGSRRQG